MGYLQNLAYKLKFEQIRRLRFIHYFYNILNFKKLKYLKPLYQNIELKRSRLRSLNYNFFKTIPSTPSWLDKEDSASALLSHPVFKTLKPEYQDELKNWSKNGYVHLKGFFTSELSDKLALETEKLWESTDGSWRYGDRKVLSAFENEDFWSILNNQKMNAIISMLLGHEVVVLNSIHFMRGDEQPLHSDSFYMTTHPIGKLIGSWTALEDIHRDAGPLSFCPGSHTLPYIMNEDINNEGNWFLVGNNGEMPYINKIKEIVANNNLKIKYHLPKKGDLFLWHANLLHGGSEIFDKNKTRKSMVAHFVSKEAICYHEITQRPAFRHLPPVNPSLQ